jgi:hypothetical protein
LTSRLGQQTIHIRYTIRRTLRRSHVNFRTAARRMLVGLVVRPQRVLWLFLAALGEIWLADRTSSHGVSSWFLPPLIVVGAAVIAVPVMKAALRDGERRYRAKADTAAEPE